MAKPTKTVLFVGPPGDARAAAAAAGFTAAVGRIGLPVSARATDIVGLMADDRSAVRVIVLVRSAEPAVRERFADRPDVVEVWDAPADEAQVSGLIARLLGGKSNGPPEPAAMPKPVKLPVVKVGRETAGRRGKGVTVVWEIPLGEDGLKELAAKLKERCGTGGTVKDGRIEIQGDHRDRLVAELEKLGYKAKRAGG